MSPRRRVGRDGGCGGFTLVEILIVVIILGVLAAIVIPMFANASTEASNTAFVSNLRSFAERFILYQARTGDYPADQIQGVTPPELVGELDAAWEEPTPIGGEWDWDFGQFGFTAGVSVFMPDRTDAQMAEVDRMLDDGDLATGSFRKRNQGFIFILEP